VARNLKNNFYVFVRIRSRVPLEYGTNICIAANVQPISSVYFRARNFFATDISSRFAATESLTRVPSTSQKTLARHLGYRPFERSKRRPQCTITSRRRPLWNSSNEFFLQSFALEFDPPATRRDYERWTRLP